MQISETYQIELYVRSLINQKGITNVCFWNDIHYFQTLVNLLWFNHG